MNFSEFTVQAICFPELNYQRDEITLFIFCDLSIFLIVQYSQDRIWKAILPQWIFSGKIQFKSEHFTIK